MDIDSMIYVLHRLILAPRTFKGNGCRLNYKTFASIILLQRKQALFYSTFQLIVYHYPFLSPSPAGRRQHRHPAPIPPPPPPPHFRSL